jgi:ElaB/YqjD/DUF883 family membrane-anchored ribosome-binding protein
MDMQEVTDKVKHIAKSSKDWVTEKASDLSETDIAKTTKHLARQAKDFVHDKTSGP